MGGVFYVVKVVSVLLVLLDVLVDKLGFKLGGKRVDVIDELMVKMK